MWQEPAIRSGLDQRTSGVMFDVALDALLTICDAHHFHELRSMQAMKCR